MDHGRLFSMGGVDPGMAKMLTRGGERHHDSPDGPVCGAAFDQEQRRMFDCISTLLPC